MPKISIITPVYCDSEEKTAWLDEMIKSVISQTVADWELILINDKSPMLLDYIKSKYADDTRLRWLDNANNEGPAKTRNTAVALAESDCILPLDSDDMLADNEVLEIMYDAWLMDKTKIIYGNLQTLIRSHDGFKKGKVFSLGSYTFELAMNLEGVMPVTAMHSIDCHENTLYKRGDEWVYGWKHELNEGLEDLEYWIAAGERGYCGQKIQHTTLLYRRHDNSRAYKMKHISQNFREMQQRIKSMHAPIYRGEFPMACCGKGKSSVSSNISVDPTAMSRESQNQQVRVITTLNERGFDFPESDLEWVSYQGPKTGSAGRVIVRGPSHLPGEYPNMGKGHFFQIHKRHHDFFSQRQNLGFRVNQPDPREQAKPEPAKIEQPAPQVVELSKPELSTLVRLDKVGGETRQADIQEVIVEPNAPASYSDTMTVQQMPTDYFKSKWHVSALNLSNKLTTLLYDNEYTVESLADTTPQELSGLPGIGIKRASTIINKAKELINNR